MKIQMIEKVAIPSGVSCVLENGLLTCSKNGVSVSRSMLIPRTTTEIKGSEIILSCKKGNKKDYKTIKSYVAHINNLFAGLDKKAVYELEACNVHFPITMKVDSGRLLINNFLGEKNPRVAVILPGVDVQLKGAKITVTSADKDSAGQTAANIEKATKIRNRDRRIFQDGIYIVERPGRKE